jgi:hypothetical protein
MPLLDLAKMTSGLSRNWARFLRDWDRTLRSGNYPETTRYNYLLAAAQLARYLTEYSPDPEADDAAAVSSGETVGGPEHSEHGHAPRARDHDGLGCSAFLWSLGLAGLG